MQNRGSFIGDSCEDEEDGFTDVEASVEPFAFVAEAIDGKWRMNFPRTEKDFLGKIENGKTEIERNAKPYRNLGICSDTISQNQGLKTEYFIN